MEKFSIIFRYGHTFIERKLKKYELGFSEHHILMYIAGHENVNQEAITRSFMIDKGAVAKTVGKLEEKGLITRVQNPDNKRENLISISEKGKSIISDMRGILSDWNDGVYQGISESDIAVTKKVLEKMIENAAILLDEET